MLFGMQVVAAWEVACGAFLSPFGVPASSEIRRWERFCDRLTQLQRRIKFAPLESFTVGDRTFPLPLETTGPSSGCPCQEEIPYLNGFFDGDGCVSMEKSHGSDSYEDLPKLGLRCSADAVQGFSWQWNLSA